MTQRREKGRVMAGYDEQSPPKRQTQTRLSSNSGTNSTEPQPLMYTSKRERPPSIPQTDAFYADEGLSDPPRQSTSSLRLQPPGSAPSQRTGSTPAYGTSGTTPIPRRQTAPAATRELPPRSTRVMPPPPQPAPQAQDLFQRLRHMHWLFFVGLGMIGAILLWTVGSAVLAWGVQRYNDVRYGTPRTYHVDQAVGHGGDSLKQPSHFIAMNLHHKAIVIELRGGDPAKSITYVAPVLIVGDNDEAPVTLDFRDVTGDKKLDMIITIHIPGQDQVSVFINDNDKFRPATNNDNIHL